MTYRLASLTFNSEYWVEVSIDGLITQRVLFYTPVCNLTVDSTLTNCSHTSTVDYEDETQPPPTVGGPGEFILISETTKVNIFQVVQNILLNVIFHYPGVLNVIVCKSENKLIK